MSILGLGVDLVETARIQKAWEQFGDPFLQRIYLPAEIAYAQNHPHPVQHLAARFAAKEAISKAFGTGLGEAIGWLDLEIVKEPSGAPQVKLHGRAAVLAESRKVKLVLISLSHTEHYAAANAILIGHDPAE